MSLHDFPALPRVGTPAPAARPTPPVAAPPSQAPKQAGFGEVLDLQAARAARSEPIPSEVLEDMARAAELVERLSFEGRQVKFDTHRLSGQIVAGLCDASGAVVKQLSLTDVVMGQIPDGAA